MNNFKSLLLVLIMLKQEDGLTVLFTVWLNLMKMEIWLKELKDLWLMEEPKLGKDRQELLNLMKLLVTNVQWLQSLNRSNFRLVLLHQFQESLNIVLPGLLKCSGPKNIKIDTMILIVPKIWLGSIKKLKKELLNTE